MIEPYEEDFQHVYRVIMKKLEADTEFSKINRGDLAVCALALERACKKGDAQDDE